VDGPFGASVTSIMVKQARVERWFVLLCAAPLIVSISVYVEASIAALSLGHWPTPSVNDPKDLATWPLHLLVAALVLTVYPAAIFTVAVTARSWRVLRTASAYRWWFAMFIVGHIGIQLSARFDPWRVWYWWWD